jgi:hypothetical protein
MDSRNLSAMAYLYNMRTNSRKTVLDLVYFRNRVTASQQRFPAKHKAWRNVSVEQVGS